MMPDLTQSNSGGWIGRAVDKAGEIKDGITNGLDSLNELAGMIVNAVDWIGTYIFNPRVLLAEIDQLSLVVVIVLLVLKMLGFKELEKWIWLGILLKVIAMIFV